MADPIQLSDFSRGANNRVPADRIPEGFVRDAINFDPLQQGGVAMRAGYNKVYEGTDVRGVVALDHRLLLADGTDLIEFDTQTNSTRVLRTIAGSGAFAGAVLNRELFFCTANECLRYDGQSVRTWGVPTPLVPPAVVAAGGALRAGAYHYSVTFVDAAGDEGGSSTTGAFVASADGSRVTIELPEPPAGGRVRLYMSPGDTLTQYLQVERTTGDSVDITVLEDDILTLGTQFAKGPTPATHVAVVNGVLLLAVDNVVWMTHPLRPHLLYYNRGFFQFPAPVTLLLASGGGMYVGADRTYWVAGAEGPEPTTLIVDDQPPVPGTGVAQGSDGVMWMSQYGPVVGAPGGEVQFLTRPHYVPTMTSHGASGIIEHNGNLLAVTTLRGIPQESNPLAAGDYVEAEIVYP